MLRYPEFLLSLIMAAAGYTHADSVIDLCPRRHITSTVPVASSAFIRSPGYPDKFTGLYSCILTIRVPEYTLVTLVVDGPFRLFDSCNEYRYFELHAPQQMQQICGSKDNNTELFRACTGDSPFNISAWLYTSSGWSNTADYMFNIKYTAFNALSNNSNRSMKSQRELYFVSHRSCNGVDDYPNNIHTAITITDLGLHTSVRLEFPDGLGLADGEYCSDYMDIVGVRGYANNTKRLCGSLSTKRRIHLTSAANELVLSFNTNSLNTAKGFRLKYTVISEGCSKFDLPSNATLSPTPDSNSTFTLTCLPGFVTSESTQTQTVGCIEKQWIPSLTCQTLPTTSTPQGPFPTSLSTAAIAGGVTVGIASIVTVSIAVICWRRKKSEVRANQALPLPAPAAGISEHNITDGDDDYLSPISTRHPVNTEPTSLCGNYTSLIQRTGNDDKYEALRPESPSSAPLLHVQRGGDYEISDVMYPTYYNLPRKTLNNDAEYEYPMECLTRCM